MDNLSKAKEEVIRFSEYITAWFKGEERVAAAGSEGVLQYISHDFRMVSPNGVRRDRQDLASWLPAAFGQYPEMRITINDIQGYATQHHVLLTYTETQHDGTNENTRYSSAVFIREGEHMVWLNLWEMP
ncbi:nuclear transport factor 2 family protein [Chitinophaga flava]|uniref:SnoaL-like domain-containing protein n=1 Tax=Chitinophaga flava TaxID=2259036 RepID=A0A365XVU1_9BACT|nr:DUF4440 domain-containing protein [Chitinophaga flava]RBL89834.1 hypothetical protein DF182_25460 [Chitinophaga flava]